MAETTSVSGYGVGRTTDVVSDAMERARAAASRRAKQDEPVSTSGSVSGASRGEDRVEVSAMALYVSKMQQLPAIREDLVARVRAQIVSGGYDTDERLNAAMDEMMKDVGL